MGKWKSHNLSEMQVFQCLGQSKWTICSRLSKFCCSNFPNFSLLSWEANSYHPRHGEGGKWENQNLPTWVRCCFSVPGALKLDHMQQIKPILFLKFYNFITFVLGGQFLLPQTGGSQKWENGNLPTLVRCRFFSAWGIQTGPFATDLANFFLVKFKFFYL